MVTLSAGDLKDLEGDLKMKDLVKQRGSIRGRLTSFENYVGDLKRLNIGDITESQFNELNLRLIRIESLFDEFEKCQNQIELHCAILDDQIKERETTETKFYCNISSAQSLLKLRPLSDDHNRRCSINSSHENLNVKLPVIKLPSFDGNYFMWLEFRDTFESLIHKNETVPDINKFHYLRSSLEGSASQVIKSIEFSSQNYYIAWDLLCQRYDNKKILINNHLKALFRIEPIVKESHKSLRYLIDVVTKNLRALTTLGQPVSQWDTIIIFMISNKLDSVTSSKWEEKRNDLSDSPLLSDFIEFLRNRADVLETTLANRHHDKNSSNANKDNHFKPDMNKGQLSYPKFSKTFVSASSAKSIVSFSCPLCNQGHRIIDCESFKALPHDSKISQVLKLNLCINCLRRGHDADACRLGSCRLCNKKHNTLLHKENNAQTSSQVTSPEPSCAPGVVTSPRTLSVKSSGQVLLGTALIRVTNPINKKSCVARVLLDAGSQSSFLTENLKEKIGLVNRDPDSLLISGINNLQLTVSDRCDVTITSMANRFQVTLNCLVIPQITGHLPNIAVNINQINLPNDISLADPQFYQPAEVDMLLGAEIFFNALCAERRMLGPNMPVLQNTLFGWIVAGPLNSSLNKPVQEIHCNFTREISDQLTKFWNLEEIPSAKVPISADDEFCESHFIKNTCRLPDGRFSVLMPLKESPEIALGDTYKMAAKRFYNLEKKLDKTPELKRQYSDFIHEYATLGHLSKINKPEFGIFLPHHCVIRNNSESTKLRVVFDASAKSTSGKSLNDIQFTGPAVQDDLFNILIRFRQHKYVFTGDIQKCYRQIKIDASQRNLQLILWRDDASKPLDVLQLNTVTYGTASAPYLSTRCLHQLGLECPDSIVSEVIKKDLYMDDLLTGADSKDSLAHILRGVTRVLSSGCFPLHKFRSNCPEIFQDSTSSESLDLSKKSSVLGVNWTPDTDNLNFAINMDKHDVTTKRTILSNTCQVFDPLGLISPCTVTLKMLLQRLWQLKLTWDEPVPTDIKRSWSRLADNLHILLSVSVPRHVLSLSPAACELHCFVDASQDAYAACVYVRTKDHFNCVTVKLLCAKTRVSPLKVLTIPRLELSAALLGARLMNKVSQALRCTIDNQVFWSDSTITLGWIKTQPRLLKTFVCNRINEIHELTHRNSWRYVPTDVNPADLASRGVDPSHLLNSSLWWEGPEFLKHNEDQWPQIPKTDITLPEIKIVQLNLNGNNEPNQLIKIENYSSSLKLKRILAYVCRFIENSKIKNKLNRTFGPLTEHELSRSLTHLIKISQSESFSKELNLIKNKKRLTSPHLLQLSPFLDDDGVLRLGGRLENTDFNFDRKHPVLLHSNHHFTKLLMRAEHLRLLHAGPQLLLAGFRDQFWPIKGRTLARQTYHKCVICTRFRAKAMEPLMGQLPSTRVNRSHPFEICGSDFAGPILIASKTGRGNRISKCYICLFVCFCTKAIHLEIVSDLSSNAFISCLRRFISRRGRPCKLFCDNGRNYVGASNELGRALKSAMTSIYNFTAEERIQFVFNPPYSPTFGALWEGNVRCIKHHLKRVIGNSSLTYEELSTLCTQIEAVLNSRPLTPLTSNPTDLSPLTPGHFLIGRPLTSIPSPPATPEKNIKTRYQLIETLRESFWKRWKNEYLAELQRKTKWKHPYRDLREGSMVVFKDDNLPPMRWKLARVHRLYPGKDGVNRVADFRTNRGIERRALNRVCPLLEDDKDEALEAPPVPADTATPSAASNGAPGC